MEDEDQLYASEQEQREELLAQLVGGGGRGHRRDPGTAGSRRPLFTFADA